MAGGVAIEGPSQLYNVYYLCRHIFGGIYGFLFSVTMAFTRWMRICVLAGY